MPASLSSSARRYADAVFELAQEEKRFDEWERDLELIASIFRGPEVIAWLGNPRIPVADKEALIDTGLAATGHEAANLARLLVADGRPHLIEQILADYRERVDQARGIVHARVTTAVPLTDAERQSVLEHVTQMTHQQVTLETAVDPSIIGGIVIRIGDRLIDGSARTRLLELKRRLAGATR